ncbi:Glycopeptide antibiotics resistance protein [Plantibacter flavus]|uniref:Glycopeptide antibiotics resistance protein n=1 Tax=Plantibacter flavus TaxID=150123 RepID=A0A3N2C849_9MICO|nr:VanZ family protein [Plantibacter flavus]ROR83494.1 glycopeptide antibiotics resistance protein [Plantibacter flavus]SMG24153.1 Glycopeptide antibiotics resistance protein [Plantibacter flavus]
MSGWTWQAWVGLVGGTLIFFAVLGPILLVQLRRYGQMSLPRVIGAAAVSVYAVALVAYTLLPLPDTRDNCVGSGGSLELIPGHSIGDIARETAGQSLLSTLTSHAMLQVVMNVILFIPFGAIARRYWNRSLGVSILLGALVSLLVESTQLTGIWGLYECSYRVADVDDLIANTAGAAIGALIAPIVLAWMPSSHALRATRGAARPVTVWRRWFGMILDAVAVQVSITVLSLVFVVPRVLLTGATGPANDPTLPEVLSIGAGTVIVVIVLPALIGSGASLGQRLVWLAPQWRDGRGSAVRRLYRASVVALPYIAATTAGQLPEATQGPTQTIAGFVGLLSALVVTIAVASVPFTRNRHGLSFTSVGADLRDARTTTP